MMRSICVFCGSKNGTNPAFKQLAIELAALLVKQNMTLIYGAGDIGLMGVIANEVLRLDGRVIGVIPQHLCKKEIVHDGLHALHVTDNMLDRKALMLELADGFIALPGGLGTLDEILEVATWAQLGQLDKPLCLINSHGFYQPLVGLLQSLTQQGFMDDWQQQLMHIEPTAQSALEYLQNFQAAGKQPA